MTLLLVAMLAAAPLGVATIVDSRRIVTATAGVVAIAEALQRNSDVREAGTDVLIGPGKLPKGDRQSRWLLGVSKSLQGVVASERVSVTDDPWQQSYIVNLGAKGSPIWVLSAGANGVIETPFEGADAPGGDDIGIKVW